MSNNKKKDDIVDKIVAMLIQSLISFLLYILWWIAIVIVILLVVWGGLISTLWWIFWWNKTDNKQSYVNSIIALDARANSTFYEDFFWIKKDQKIIDKAYLLNEWNKFYVISRKSLNLSLFGYFNSPILTKEQIQNNIEFDKKKLYSKDIKWSCTKLVDSGDDYKEEKCWEDQWLIDWIWHFPLLQLFNPYMLNPSGYGVTKDISKYPSFFDIYKKKKDKIDYWSLLNTLLQKKQAGYIKNGLRITANNWYSIESRLQTVDKKWKSHNDITFQKVFGNYHNINYTWVSKDFEISPNASYSFNISQYLIPYQINPYTETEAKNTCENHYSYENKNMNCTEEKVGKMQLSVIPRINKSWKNHSWHDISWNWNNAIFNPFLWGWYYLWTYFNWTNSQSYLLSNVWARLRVYSFSVSDLEAEEPYKKYSKKMINKISFVTAKLCSGEGDYVKGKLISESAKETICGSTFVKLYPNIDSGSAWENIIKLVTNFGDKVTTKWKTMSETLYNAIYTEMKIFLVKTYLYAKINNIDVLKTPLLKAPNTSLSETQIKSLLLLLKKISSKEEVLKAELNKSAQAASKVYAKTYKPWYNRNTDTKQKEDLRILQNYFINSLMISDVKNIHISILNITNNLSTNPKIQKYKKDIYFHIILRGLHTNWNFILDKKIYQNLKNEFMKKFDSYINIDNVTKYILPLLEKKNAVIINSKDNVNNIISTILWLDTNIDNLTDDKLKDIIKNLDNKTKVEKIKKIVAWFYQSNVPLSKIQWVNNFIDSNIKGISAPNIKLPKETNPQYWAGAVLDPSHPNKFNIKDVKNFRNNINKDITNKELNLRNQFDLMIDNLWKVDNNINNKNNSNWNKENIKNKTIIKKENKLLFSLIKSYITEYKKAVESEKIIEKVYAKLNQSSILLKNKINRLKDAKNDMLSNSIIPSSDWYPEESDIIQVLKYGQNHSVTGVFPFINYGDLFAYKGNVWTSEGTHLHLEIIPFITKHKFVQIKELKAIENKLLGKTIWEKNSLVTAIGGVAKNNIDKILTCDNNDKTNCMTLTDILEKTKTVKDKVEQIKNTLNLFNPWESVYNISTLTSYSKKNNFDNEKNIIYNNFTAKDISEEMGNAIEKLSDKIDTITKYYKDADNIFNMNFIAPWYENKTDKDGYAPRINSGINNNLSDYAILLWGSSSSNITLSNKTYYVNSIPCNEVWAFKNKVCNYDNNFNSFFLNDKIGYDDFQKLSAGDDLFMSWYLHKGKNTWPPDLSVGTFNSFLKLFAVEYYNKLSRYITIEPLPLFNFVTSNNSNGGVYVGWNNSLDWWIIWNIYLKQRLKYLNEDSWLEKNMLKSILYNGNTELSDENSLLYKWGGTSSKEEGKYCKYRNWKMATPEDCYVGVTANPNTLYNDINIYWWTNFLEYPFMTAKKYKNVFYNFWLYQFLYYYIGDLQIKSWHILSDFNKYWLSTVLHPFAEANGDELGWLTKGWTGSNPFHIWLIRIKELFDQLSVLLNSQKEISLKQQKRIYENTIIKSYYYNLYLLTRLDSTNAFFKSNDIYLRSGGFILPYDSIMNRSDIYLKIIWGFKWIVGSIYNSIFNSVKSIKDILIDTLNNETILSKFKTLWISETTIKNTKSKDFNYLYNFINKNSWTNIFNNDTTWPLQLYSLWFYNKTLTWQQDILDKLKNVFDNIWRSSMSIIDWNYWPYLYSDIDNNLVYKIYNDTFIVVKLDIQKNTNNLNIKKIIKITINTNNNSIKTISEYITPPQIKSLLEIYSNIPFIKYLKILNNDKNGKNVMSVSLLLFNEILDNKNDITNLINSIKNTDYITNSISNNSIKLFWKIKLMVLKWSIFNFNKISDKLRYSLWKYGETLYLDSGLIETDRYHISNSFIIPDNISRKIISNGWMKLPDSETSTLDWLIETFKKTKEELKTIYNAQVWTHFNFTEDKLLMSLAHFFVESWWRNWWYWGGWMTCYTNDNNNFINISPRNWRYITKTINGSYNSVRYNQNYIRVGNHPISARECYKELKKIREGIWTKTIYIYSTYSQEIKDYTTTIDNFVIKPNKTVILYAFDNNKKNKWIFIAKQFYKYLNWINYSPVMKWFSMSTYPIDWNINWLWFVWMWQMDPYVIFNLKWNWIYKYLTKNMHVSWNKAAQMIKQSSAFTQLVLLEYLWNYNHWYKLEWLPPPKTLLNSGIINLSNYKGVVHKWLRRYNHSLNYRNKVLLNYQKNKEAIKSANSNISYTREYKVKILTYIYLKIITLKKIKHPEKTIQDIEEKTSQIILNKNLINQFTN